MVVRARVELVMEERIPAVGLFFGKVTVAIRADLNR